MLRAFPVHCKEVEDFGEKVPMDTAQLNENDEHQAGLDTNHLAFDGPRTVLVADDEEIVRMVLEEMLVRLGFDVLTAEDGTQALEIFSQDPDKFGLVIFDMTMPTMDGGQLFREIRRIHPNVKAVLSSGYHDKSSIDELREFGLSGYLPKPYNIYQIEEELMRVLSQPEPEA